MLYTRQKQLRGVPGLFTFSVWHDLTGVSLDLTGVSLDLTGVSLARPCHVWLVLVMSGSS